MADIRAKEGLTYHLIDSLEITTPALLSSFLALWMPAILHNIAKATHCAAECGVTVLQRAAVTTISPPSHVVPRLGKIFQSKEIEEVDLLLLRT